MCSVCGDERGGEGRTGGWNPHPAAQSGTHLGLLSKQPRAVLHDCPCKRVLVCVCVLPCVCLCIIIPVNWYTAFVYRIHSHPEFMWYEHFVTSRLSHSSFQGNIVPREVVINTPFIQESGVHVPFETRLHKSFCCPHQAGFVLQLNQSNINLVQQDEIRRTQAFAHIIGIWRLGLERVYCKTFFFYSTCCICVGLYSGKPEKMNEYLKKKIRICSTVAWWTWSSILFIFVLEFDYSLLPWAVKYCTVNDSKKKVKSGLAGRGYCIWKANMCSTGVFMLHTVLDISRCS